MQLHLQNPINWACFTGLEDSNKVRIIMITAQKSVTLGLLKLTLNKLIPYHSSTGSPLLSTLQHHCSCQQSAWHTALWGHGYCQRTAQPRQCPWAHIHHCLPGVVRPAQGCTGTCSFLPAQPVGFLHWRNSSQHGQASHVLGLISFLPAIIKWHFFVVTTFLRHQGARLLLWFQSNY